jgi:D-sedoheptulose 7-phosphate isomerase
MQVPLKQARMEQIVEAEMKALVLRYPALADIRASFAKSCELMIQSISSGGKLLFCGNGGSAADCEHIAGELLKGFLSHRKVGTELTQKLVAELGESEGRQLASQIQMAIPAISLTSHISFHTAFGNDMNYEYAFAQHLLGLGKSGDCLIAISTSGNSKNVLHAVKLAKVLGIQTVALTGATGGLLKPLCQASIQAPTLKVHEIQEFHLPIYHAFCLVLERYFFEA